jgi:hypothetical protein
MITWILLLRAIHLTTVAFFYFVCLGLMYWSNTKRYMRYYVKVRFVLKTILSIFYFVVVYELYYGITVSNFHLWVSILLILLDIAEMWSRSYKTYGFKEVKKGFGKLAYFLI